MARQVIGAEGTVASWTGTFYSNLVSKTRPMSVTVQASADAIDFTGLGSYGREFRSGLGQWTANIEAYTLTQSTNTAPNIGNAGNVTFTNSTNVYIDSFTVNINAPAIETTTFNPTVLWRTFRPGVATWSGTLNARIDDTNNVPLPFLTTNAAVSATFTYDTNATLAGNIIITNVAPAMSVDGVTVVPITFQGTGALTPAGTASVLGTTAFCTGATGIPEWNSDGSSAKALTINLAGSNTLTGADSFWTSLALTCGVSQATRLAIGVRGSGQLAST